MMLARYADGRAAITHDIVCQIGPEALAFDLAGVRHLWIYASLQRADDDNGVVTLKRKPDTGERLVLSAEAAALLRQAAPSLFTSRARGVERPIVVASLAGAAFALAASFLIGVPMAAGPIANIMPPQYRTQISDISWSQVEAITDYCDTSDEAARILNDMAHRMMTASNVEGRDAIWITIVDAPIANAFALPDGTIIVTDGLIDLAEHPDELAGVIAHEIAHIERDHVLKNIVSRIGAGIFFDVVFGGAGVGQAIAVASVSLAGLRYSRAYEEEADTRGLDYLDAAHIDPGGLARMFDRLRETYEGDEADGAGRIPALLSTHPDSAARAERARARARPGLTPALSNVEWRTVRAACTASLAPAPSIVPEDGAVAED